MITVKLFSGILITVDPFSKLSFMPARICAIPMSILAEVTQFGPKEVTGKWSLGLHLTFSWWIVADVLLLQKSEMLSVLGQLVLLLPITLVFVLPVMLVRPSPELTVKVANQSWQTTDLAQIFQSPPFSCSSRILT